MMEAIADQIAYCLNDQIDLSSYLPIISNALRCLDDDLERVLALNGIDASLQTIAKPKMRRLAAVAAVLRSWRGSFLAHKAIVTALSGGTSIVRSYIAQRVVVDVSDIDFILTFSDQYGTTDYFVLGQGPSGEVYDEAETAGLLQSLAMPALDGAVVVPCWALSAWRDGYDGWDYNSIDPVLVETVLPTRYAGLVIGPDAFVSPPDEQYLRTRTVKDETTGPETERITVWFQTEDTTVGDYWEIYAYATEDGPDSGAGDAYVFRINVKYGTTTIHKKVGGTVASAMASFVFNIPDDDGFDGAIHRVDITVIQATDKVRLRIGVNGDFSYWYDDPGPYSGRPLGIYAFIGLNASTTFTTGKIRVIAMTAMTLDKSDDVFSSLPIMSQPNAGVLGNLLGITTEGILPSMT